MKSQQPTQAEILLDLWDFAIDTTHDDVLYYAV